MKFRDLINSIRQDSPKLGKICFGDYYFVSFFLLFLASLSVVTPLLFCYEQIHLSIFIVLGIYAFCILMLAGLTIRTIVLVLQNDW